MSGIGSFAVMPVVKYLESSSLLRLLLAGMVLEILGDGGFISYFFCRQACVSNQKSMQGYTAACGQILYRARHLVLGICSA